MRARPTPFVRRAAALALLHGLCASALAQPLATAFTYQGELRTSGTPASGLHDMRFRLYDSPSGGAQVGTTLCADNVTLTQGRFTVLLDFFSQYAGQKRFLEIEVRADTGLDCSNAAGFTLLSPRQELTATPNASFALNAAVAALANTATTATSATTATTATNSTQLNGQGASFYQNAANLNSGSIPGSRLQGTYPGIVQMENAGNTFAGTGTGLVGLNASNLSSGTIDPSRLPVPFFLSGAAGPNQAIIGTDTSSPDSNAMGLYGGASATTGFTFGVQGRSASTGGVGVIGWANGATGGTLGVFGLSSSDAGSGVEGWASAGSGITNGVYARSDSTDGVGSLGFASAGTGATFGAAGITNSTAGVGVKGQANSLTGPSRGVWGSSVSPDGQGVSGSAYALTGAAVGVWGESSSTAGTGVVGYANAASGNTTGVSGSVNSPAGRAVYGLANATTGTTSGVFGEALSANGTGVEGIATSATGANYGVTGRSYGTFGVGVFGQANAATSATLGVLGQSVSTTGIGVKGWATAATGVSYGVVGQSDSTTGVGGQFRGRGGDAVYIENFGAGRGVHVVAPGDTSVWAETTTGVAGVDARTSNTAGYGVLGINFGTTGSSYGVAGQTSSATNGFGVFAFGRSGASGTKAFRIDHPDDPENKYLLHYSAESPEVINFYRGTVVLDGAGMADIELPGYFSKINTSPSYQLTAVGAPMPLLHIAVEIDERSLSDGAKAGPAEAAPICRFRIAGGAAGKKVSWEVKAVRNDQWVRQHGAPVEVEKQGLEKGTYQHPELYGQPEARSTISSARDAAHETPAASRGNQP